MQEIEVILRNAATEIPSKAIMDEAKDILGSVENLALIKKINYS